MIVSIRKKYAISEISKRMPGSTVKTRLRVALFSTCVSIFVFLYFVSNGNPVVDHAQKPPRQKPTADDESLLRRFTVEPLSVELSLPNRTEINPKDAVWLKVHSTKSKFFIYSAYLDDRIETVGPLVRIIGAAKTENPDTAWCRLWYSNSSKTVSAYVHSIREHRDLDYSAMFVLCKLPSGENRPSSVSVVSNIRNPITNELLIHKPPKRSSGFKTDIGICIKPFHSTYNKDTQLMEFVEFYYLLGARHFTFYSDDVGSKVQCVLDRYLEDKLISHLPWHLDLVSNKETRAGGSVAAANDCVYRNMYRSRHVAFVDVDEFVVPRRDDTLVQMINAFELRSNGTPPAAYVFPHAFFCTEYPDDESYRNESRPLLVLTKTSRQDLVCPHGARSKSICDPRRVVEAGHHFVREYVNDAADKTTDVPSDVALLHHYRQCSDAGKYCDRDEAAAVESETDRTIYKYKDRLVDRITKTHDGLDMNCLIEAVPYY